MISSRSLVLLALVAGLANASVLVHRSTKNSCPTITTKPDFNYVPYAGLWYEIHKFPNAFQQGLNCVQAQYLEIEPGVVSVFNAGVYEDGTTPDNITGSATALNPEEPGALTVTFPGRPDGTYWVLDTDYEVYSSVYSCTAVGPYVLEFAWILARQNTLTEEQTALALTKYEQFGIDISKFTLTYQSDSCNYVIAP